MGALERVAEPNDFEAIQGLAPGSEASGLPRRVHELNHPESPRRHLLLCSPENGIN